MAEVPSSTHYDILQVPGNASGEDIRAAYRRLARDHHPDRAGADGEAMAAINRAYEVLSDPDRRARYDIGLASRPPPRKPGRVVLPGDRARARAIWVGSVVAAVVLAGAGAMLVLRSREAPARVAAPAAKPAAKAAVAGPVTEEGLRLIQSRSMASWPRADEKAQAASASR